MRDNPGEAVRAVIARLPAGPGVYRFRDARGRPLYLGRAASLRRRVGSYWGHLGDRPHLAAMVAAVASVEAVECASDHEAAWLERSLLSAALPRWNKTPGGQEVEVYLLLTESARSPGLTVVHTPGRGPGVRCFGPYLGGSRVRLAVGALLRVYPLDYAGDVAGTARELAPRRGADQARRPALAAAIAAVLAREHAAVTAARAGLAALRNAAVQAEAYERAARLHTELAALDWMTTPQRVALASPVDADACGWADGVLSRFGVRGGRIRVWRQERADQAAAAPLLAQTPPGLRDFADVSARLAARLAAPVG